MTKGDASKRDTLGDSKGSFVIIVDIFWGLITHSAGEFSTQSMQ